MYPEYTQLKKGEYTVRLMLRHDSQELLEKLSGLTLVRAKGCVPSYTKGLLPLFPKGMAALFTSPAPKLPPPALRATGNGRIPACFSLIPSPSRSSSASSSLRCKAAPPPHPSCPTLRLPGCQAQARVRGAAAHLRLQEGCHCRHLAPLLRHDPQVRGARLATNSLVHPPVKCKAHAPACK